MQIATLSYQYAPKGNINGDNRAKLRHQSIRTTLTYPQKKHKQRQSLLTDITANSLQPLPPIAKNGKRPSSIRIKGNSLPSSKLGDSSAFSFNHQSRSHSRLSNKSELSGVKSRSVSPGGTLRPGSKIIRLKFGYPIKLRSADFYAPNKSESELHLREESFVNDCIRSAHQSRRSSIIPPYEALDDPHLRKFFQSPIVLDIVRKTLNVDPNTSYKQDERSSKTSKKKTNTNRNNDYHQFVTKRSSGYAKLNGYDCIPSHSPARHHHHHRSSTQDRYPTSVNTSVTSFPTDSSQQQQQQKKTKSRKYDKYQQLKPIATSSPLRHHLPVTQKNKY